MIKSVITRDGFNKDFDLVKITTAVNKAFASHYGDAAINSSFILTKVKETISEIETNLTSIGLSVAIPIEDLQDLVEKSIMKVGEYDVAKRFIIYREQRNTLREKNKSLSLRDITLSDGTLVTLKSVTKELKALCKTIQDVHPEEIAGQVMRDLFNGASKNDLVQAKIKSASSMIERDPSYSKVAARILLNKIYDEVGITRKVSTKDRLLEGVEAELINPQLLSLFDLDAISEAIDNKKDLNFQYLGIQTVYDRYLLHNEERRIESPQGFLMRVAMGLALNESDPTAAAIEFYNQLSTFDSMSSTPTLFNSGTLKSQLSSCYLSTIPDDIGGIYDGIKDNAFLQKWAGGIGNDWTPVRALGSLIKGTNGKSQGIVPFLKVANDTAIAVNQGGKRKGAVCAYLETWHLDIEEFLELRKNTGDDRRRTHDMNIANWIPDLFMERAFSKGTWTLFSPSDAKDLHDLCGNEFRKAYEAYEAKAADKKIRHRVVDASTLFNKMLTMLYETGHPWLTFKDPCNLRSPQSHVGVVHSSNLCVEITLNTSADEIAVCNLASINLVNHLIEVGGKFVLNVVKLKKTIKTAVRMLDNVIDLNYYPVIQAQNSNLRHRPIGLGIMGFQDMLHVMKTPYDSDEAIEVADEVMEVISYYAIEASHELSLERGSYSTFEGSLWSKGILPIDSLKIVEANRPAQHCKFNYDSKLDWTSLREKVKLGMRNSNVMAIAPTATISNIVGVSASIEPDYQQLYVKSNLSGEFTVINSYLVNELKTLGLWDEGMIKDLKFYDGDIGKIDRIPFEVKNQFKTAFQVPAERLILSGARRQKWIDQSQSLNIYVVNPKGKELRKIYRLAWESGTKTTYYLRSLGASSAEKSTSDGGELQSVLSEPKVCSIENPECESCQ